MSRYYPGFLGAFFIILLRVAIGWHFLYEGWEKYESTQSGKEPFSAEIYLRNATGPLGPYFRGMVPDVNGLAELDPVRLKAAWRDDVDRINNHFGFNQDQRGEAQKTLDQDLQWADYWFSNPENQEKREKYYHDLREIQTTEGDPQSLSFEKERAWDARRSVDADQSLVVGPFNRSWSEERSVRHRDRAKLASTRNSSRPKVRCVLALEQSRATKPADHLRTDRDRCLPDGRLLDPVGGPWCGTLSGDDLSVDAPLARPASQPEGRGALLDREQEPG